MNFGEKVKDLREKQNMTQAQLAKAVNMSLRTIASYENSGVYPRTQSVYEKLAEVLKCNVNYLKTEEAEFVTEAATKYGSRGQAQAQQIVEQTAALFAGGDLSDDDKLAFMREINTIFFDSKDRAKKFTPKKYRKDSESSHE